MDRALQTKTSATLLGRLRQGTADAAAWNEFANRCGHKIYGWCRRWGLQASDAEDVTQIVLIKLLDKMKDFTYDRTRSFHGWLKTVAHHAWQDYLAAQQRPGKGSGDSQVHEMLQSVAARDDLFDHLEQDLRLALLKEAMARVRLRVEPKTWQTFHLLAIEKRAGDDVAATLEMKYHAVFQAKTRVKDMIREEIAKLGTCGPD